MSRPVSLEHTRHLARCREATLQYSETQQPLLLALKPARTYPRRVNPQPEILRITQLCVPLRVASHRQWVKGCTSTTGCELVKDLSKK
jgi:hypothetical protein